MYFFYSSKVYIIVLIYDVIVFSSNKINKQIEDEFFVDLTVQ